MSRNVVVLLFFGTCVVLGILVLLNIISSMVGAIIFAVALVTFGLLSRGFKK
jgi:hypothetical protein